MKYRHPLFLLVSATALVPSLGRPAQAQAAPRVEPAACGTENLIAGLAPSAREAVEGDVALITDGIAVTDGASWDGPAGVKLATPSATVTYDLGRPRPVGAFFLQADANDTYRVTGSLDDKPGSYRVLAEAANLVDRGHGMRSRTMEIAPVTVRYLRVGEADGDGYYSISEFSAYCRAPTPFPPALQTVEAPMAVVPVPADERAVAAPAPKSPVGPLEIALAIVVIVLVVRGLRAAGARRVADPATARERLFPLVLLLFVGSGCAALIYEIVWFQMLQLVLGSSAVSIGVLLGTFMGGMCAGSLALARYVPRGRHPLRVYAVLELGIGASGILMLGAMPLVQGIYTTVVGHGIPGLLLRGLFAAICLLPPTAMMGATLPAMSRWVRMTPRGVSWLGYFYGANTLGAVLGCLLAGFYLLRVLNMPIASFVAVALNLAVAVGALAVARRAPQTGPGPVPVSAPEAFSVAAATDTDVAASARTPRAAWPVYLTIALSGMSALGAEVIWTRLFSLLLSGTTYTFSIILGVFLIGIGLGSAAGSSIERRSADPRRALGVAQLLLIGAIAWTSWNLTSALPYWPINPRLAASPWFQFQIDFVRCLWTILPAALLWGASFPLALGAVASTNEDAGVVVGRVYAANTVGAIVGALATSLVLIAAVGTQNGERILIGLVALSALVVLLPIFSVGVAGRRSLTTRDALWGLAIALAALVAGRGVNPVPPLLVGHGRFAAVERNPQEKFLYVGEGMNSSPAVSRDGNGILSYHNAGKVQASSLPQDMRLQRMLGHLTTLVPEHPRSVLVIACGAGVTAGAASIDPRVERLTIAEIEPLVPAVVAKYFGDYNFNVVKNPKVHVEVDDARHFLNTTREKFDAITSDPFDPWVKGAANLYTREFWELAKRHLNPGGVVTVFVQLYDAGMAAVKSEVATFFEAFPNGIIWGNTVGGEGYDIVLLGQVEPTRIDVDAMEALLASPGLAGVAQSLREIGFDSATALLSTYGGRGPQLAGWLQDAQVNQDNNLRLQFLAGLGMNVDQRAEIYRGMLAYRQYPEDLFVGSPARIDALRAAMLDRQP
jgi:spermidine synthase